MWERYNLVAQSASQAGKHHDAEQQFKLALTEAEKLGPADNAIATVCNNLANCLRIQGRHAEAEAFYKRALEVRQKALGPLHKDEMIILENYAKCLRLMGREAEAKKMEERSMGIMRR